MPEKEVYLENISKNSNPKNNFYIVVNDTESKIKKTFLPPLNGEMSIEVTIVQRITSSQICMTFPPPSFPRNGLYLEMIADHDFFSIH